LIKAGWGGIALIAPEFVLWRALDQWDTARKLRDLVNKYNFPEDGQPQNALSAVQEPRATSSAIVNQQASPSSPPSTDGEQDKNTETNELQREFMSSSDSNTLPEALPLTPAVSCDQVADVDIEAKPKLTWTLEHGFFAVMGGFQISVPREYEWVLARPERILTPKGIELFVKHGLLPDVRGSQLKGRGKADQLAKALVCAQAIWMVIQTISRKASGLPVTLLELNTLAHVGCAVVMYAVWWKKPQNVNEPFDVPLSPRIGALLLSPSLSGFKRRSHLDPDALYYRRSNWEDFVPENRTSYKVENAVDPSQYVHVAPSDGREIREASRADGAVMLLNGQALEGSPFVCVVEPGYHLSLKQAKKLVSKDILGGDDDLAPDLMFCEYRDLDSFARRASNYWIRGGPEISVFKFMFILTGLSVLYAGIHASSWNGHFPTHAEAILWRIAVCYIAASGFILSGWMFLIDHTGFRFLGWFAFFTLAILVLFRCYLVVESFISIRSLPIGSYSTVSWVNFLPHIG
jgi:hypothetical protein